jgi:hypothetical protein
MNFFCWPIQGSKLIISDCLKKMLGHQPQMPQLHPHDPISFGLMVDLQRFHSLGLQGVVGHEHLAQISFHGLFLSPWLGLHAGSGPLLPTCSCLP